MLAVLEYASSLNVAPCLCVATLMLVAGEGMPILLDVLEILGHDAKDCLRPLFVWHCCFVRAMTCRVASIPSNCSLFAWHLSSSLCISPLMQLLIEALFKP